jgi:hypothetical protein
MPISCEKGTKMINLKIRWAIIALFVIVLSAGCSNTKTDKSAAKNMQNDAKATLGKAGDTLNDAGKAIQVEMDQFSKDMSANIAKTDTELQQLQVRRDAMKDEKNKAAMDARLTMLKKDRDDLQARIDKIGDQKKEQIDWKNFQNGTKSAWRDLERAVQDTFDKLSG